MQVPVQVTFRDIPVSDAVEQACWKETEKLERYCERITSCRVVVAASHRRHRKGNLFEIRVDLAVPGSTLIINREPAEHHSDEDVYVALREAFDSARRRLQDYVRRHSGRVKTPAATPHARVTKLFAGDGYGFLETIDGRELYFHRNSVLNGWFDRLAIGAEVRFAEEEGEDGPQASSVAPVGRHGHALS